MQTPRKAENFGLIESTVECEIKIDNILVMFAQFLAMIKRFSL